MTFTPSLSTFGTFSTTLSATGDFDYTVKASENQYGEKGEKGWSTMGDFEGTRRKDLIQQDAQRTLKRFEEKYDENYMPIKKKQVIPVAITPPTPKTKEKK